MTHRAVMTVLGAMIACAVTGGGLEAQAGPTAAGAPLLSGAYRFASGAHVTLAPDGEGYRYLVLESGESRRLRRESDTSWVGGPSWSALDPVAVRVIVRRSDEASARATLEWQRVPMATPTGARRARPTVTGIARRMAVVVDTVSVLSDGVRLAGTLFLPAGRDPVPLVVIAHGSECEATATYDIPWKFTALGIGVLQFDKRGCGSSGGHYTQDVTVLAADVLSAVRTIATHPRVDPARLGVAGYSQGGWIAPRVAVASPLVRFIVVGFGLAESMLAQDRRANMLALTEAHVPAAGLAEATRLIDATHALLVQGIEPGFAAYDSVRRSLAGASWLDALAPNTITWATRQVPSAAIGAQVARERGLAPGAVLAMDPVPVLRQVRVPQLWLIAADDHVAPARATVEVLRTLRREGMPVTLVTYPGADHGLVQVERRDGRRTVVSATPRTMHAQAAWIRALPGAH